LRARLWEPLPVPRGQLLLGRERWSLLLPESLLERPPESLLLSRERRPVLLLPEWLERPLLERLLLERLLEWLLEWLERLLLERLLEWSELPGCCWRWW